jgi:dipeptidyl aminopeptidase/acylaminoacyl peptidase
MMVHRGGTTSGAEVTPDGKVVFSRQSFDRPPELAVVGLDGSGLRALTTVNDALADSWRLGAVEDLTFKGASGDDVQMYVVFPPGFEPGKKYPLVHLVHGGPHNAFGDAFHFRWNAHAFAAPGYVVALVNFHGSSSFGQPFLESILGAHGDKPFTDLMKATDRLIEKASWTRPAWRRPADPTGAIW